MSKEKAKVEAVVDLKAGVIEVKIYGSRKLIEEFVEELKDAQDRKEIELLKLEIKN